MTNKGYMAFMPDWWEYKKELTPEQWYELEDYMFQLRFNGVDTETSTIQDKEIRLIWRTIRAQLKKIIRNYNYKNKGKGNSIIEINTEFEQTPVEEVKTPSLQKDKEDDRAELYERAVDGVINELINIVASGKGFDVYEKRLSEHSTVISTEYNIPFKEVKNTINKKAKNIYISQNNIKIAN